MLLYVYIHQIGYILTSYIKCTVYNERYQNYLKIDMNKMGILKQTPFNFQLVGTRWTALSNTNNQEQHQEVDILEKPRK